MLTDCTTGPEAGRKCIHPSRIITLAETIHYRNGYGAGDEARTRYLHLGKVALYRMSYTRIMWCLRSELNQRHADFQSAALPTELQRRMLIKWWEQLDSNQ